MSLLSFPPDINESSESQPEGDRGHTNFACSKHKKDPDRTNYMAVYVTFFFYPKLNSSLTFQGAKCNI